VQRVGPVVLEAGVRRADVAEQTGRDHADGVRRRRSKERWGEPAPLVLIGHR
jgi:hypothetical protein